MSGKILNIVSPAKELHVKFLSQYLLTCYVLSMFIYFKQLGSLIQDTFIPYLFYSPDTEIPKAVICSVLLRFG